MTNPLIIVRSQRHNSLVKMRDLVLALVCWGLWISVLVSIVNGDGFHLSATYLSLVLLLSLVLFLWSVVHYLINPIRNKSDIQPLSLKKLAQHFHVQSDLVSGLQHEKQVLVVLSTHGKVTQLASKQQRWRAVQSSLPHERSQ